MGWLLIWHSASTCSKLTNEMELEEQRFLSIAHWKHCILYQINQNHSANDKCNSIEHIDSRYRIVVSHRMLKTKQKCVQFILRSVHCTVTDIDSSVKWESETIQKTTTTQCHWFMSGAHITKTITVMHSIVININRRTSIWNCIHNYWNWTTTPKRKQKQQEKKKKIIESQNSKGERCHIQLSPNWKMPDGTVALRICQEGHANALALNKDSTQIAVAGRSRKYFPAESSFMYEN